MSQQSQYSLVKKLRPAKIIIPGIIGLAVVGWLIMKEMKPDVFSIALVMAIIWRIISYYSYLLIGTLIVPRRIERKFIPYIVKRKYFFS
jgi:hypothetical protein